MSKFPVVPANRRRMTESELVGVVEDAARGVYDGSWNAAAWILERRWPERWAKITARKPAPEPVAEAPEVDPFAQVVDLAKHRKR